MRKNIMRLLTGNAIDQVRGYFEDAALEAKKSLCLRSRCGTIIVGEGGVVIGRGYNAPPGDDLPLRRCDRKHELSTTFRSDRTCCVHAEQRAIMDALARNSSRLPGSTLYFIRLDDEGGMKHSGKPYCTICSKMALDAGVRFFCLYHAEGVGMYDTREYNELSFAYKEDSA